MESDTDNILDDDTCAKVSLKYIHLLCCFFRMSFCLIKDP